MKTQAAISKVEPFSEELTHRYDLNFLGHYCVLELPLDSIIFVGLKNLENLLLELCFAIIPDQSEKCLFLLECRHGSIFPARKYCSQKFSLVVPIHLVLLLFICPFLENDEFIRRKYLLKLSETDLFCYLGIESVE